MDSPTFKLPASAGTPLFPISPERMNQQRLIASPSLPSDLADLAKSPSRHHRNLSTASDVQSKVAVFNNLTRESTSQRLANDAALKRAILGREEAESELHGAKSQLSESRDRERRVGERLESLFEELTIMKERQTNERAVFEKEIRKARKEAFRASSSLVKVQEELQTARRDTRSAKEELRTEKKSRANAEQANFEIEYKFAGMTEELSTLREKVMVLEEEKKSEFIMQTLQEEVETNKGNLTQEETDAFWEKTPRQKNSNTEQKPTSSRRNRFARKASPREDAAPRDPDRWRFPGRRSFMPKFASEESDEEIDEDDLDTLKSNLRHEKRQRESAEQMVDFLKIECQFQRCSCRIAEAQGTRYIHDHEWDQQVQQMKKERQQRAIGDEVSISNPETQQRQEVETTSDDQVEHEVQLSSDADAEPASAPLISFSPTTGTFHTIPSPNMKESKPEEILLQSHQNESAPSMPQPARLEPVLQSPTPNSPPAVPLSSPPDAGQAPQEPPAVSFSALSPSSSDACETEHEPPPVSSPAFSPPPSRVPVAFATPSAKSLWSLQPTPHYAPHTTGAPTRIITDTITTSIPLAIAADDVFSPAEGATPITRAEALEQIRARRGRARSFALAGPGVRRPLLGTPGKDDRRDISSSSAPAGRY